MEYFFLKILNMSITGSYVILALLLVRLLLKKAPKKYSYALWSVALFRLVCPVSFAAVFSLFQTKLFDMSAVQNGSGSALSYIPENIAAAAAPEISTGIPAVSAAVNGALPAAAETASANPMEILIFIGAVLWLTGITALVVYNVVSFAHLKRRLMTAVRLEENVFESDKIRSPFILGFICPKIYIPFGLKPQERGYILQHERYHLKRRDHLIKLLGLSVLALHWFNPLVWLAFSLMSKDMEMSCDERVLSKTEGITRDYSTSLLSFAANRRFFAASPLAFGENAIGGRIKNILRFHKPRRFTAAVAALLCIAVTAACAVNPKTDITKNDNLNLHIIALTVNGDKIEDPYNLDTTDIFVCNPAVIPEKLAVTAEFDVSGTTLNYESDTSGFNNGENRIILTATAPDGSKRHFTLIVGKYDENGLTAYQTFKKAISLYWLNTEFQFDADKTVEPEGYNEISLITNYQTVLENNFTQAGITQFEKYHGRCIYRTDSAVYGESPAVGQDITFIGTVLTEKSVTGDSMVFTAKSYYASKTSDSVATEIKETTFRIVKQNAIWLIDEFTSPDYAYDSMSTETGTADVTVSKTTLAADASSGNTQQVADVLTTADEKEDSKSLNTPDGITVYDHGTSRSPTSDTVSGLIKAVNKHLNDDTLYYTKLYVSADTINEIRNNQSCVELRYDTEQILETSKMSGAPDEFSFSKILLCLSGEHSANIFFYNDNTYQSGTVKISSGSFCDEILEIVQ